MPNDTINERFKTGIDQVEAFKRGDRGNANVTEVKLPDVEVKKLREQLGLSQAEFANTYGIPVRTVQDWELNEKKDITRKKGVTGLFLRLISKHPIEMAKFVQENKMAHQEEAMTAHGA